MYNDPILQVIGDLKTVVNNQGSEIDSLRKILNDQVQNLELMKKQIDIKVVEIARLEGRIMDMSEKMIIETQESL